nr:Lactaldehyde reductase [Klebsiella pneumoniae]
MTDALHLKAIEIIAGALRGSVAGDAGAGKLWRSASMWRGWDFPTLGLAGARYGASARRFYNTPHGVANAILLPHVMRFNAEATGENIATSPGRWASGWKR